MLQRIMGVKYSFPANLHISRECLDMMSKIFLANPANRISIAGIKSHPWFTKNLPDELKVCMVSVRVLWACICLYGRTVSTNAPAVWLSCRGCGAVLLAASGWVLHHITRFWLGLCCSLLKSMFKCLPEETKGSGKRIDRSNSCIGSWLAVISNGRGGGGQLFCKSRALVAESSLCRTVARQPRN